MYGRINLSKVNCIVDDKIFHVKPSIEEARDVYHEYCRYKKFESIFPLYIGDIKYYEWFCYFEDHKLIAWQQTQIYPEDKVAFQIQFAWNYHNPDLELGWRFNDHVSAWLKLKGYDYLYMGDHEPYMSKLNGYEILKDEEIV